MKIILASVDFHQHGSGDFYSSQIFENLTHSESWQKFKDMGWFTQQFLKYIMQVLKGKCNSHFLCISLYVRSLNSERVKYNVKWSLKSNFKYHFCLVKMEYNACVQKLNEHSNFLASRIPKRSFNTAARMEIWVLKIILYCYWPALRLHCMT